MGILQARILEWVTHPPPGGLLNPGIKPRSSTLQADCLSSEPPGKPKISGVVAYPFSGGSSWPRNRTRVSCIAAGFFTRWVTREAQSSTYQPINQYCVHFRVPETETQKVKCLALSYQSSWLSNMKHFGTSIVLYTCSPLLSIITYLSILLLILRFSKRPLHQITLTFYLYSSIMTLIPTTYQNKQRFWTLQIYLAFF